MLPKPKKRLPERRPRVTFIVGIRCANGLVLAADSQEGDGITKRFVNKLELRGRRKLTTKFSTFFESCDDH